jgi:hypothetical protein
MAILEAEVSFLLFRLLLWDNVYSGKDELYIAFPDPLNNEYVSFQNVQEWQRPTFRVLQVSDGSDEVIFKLGIGDKNDMVLTTRRGKVDGSLEITDIVDGDCCLTLNIYDDKLVSVLSFMRLVCGADQYLRRAASNLSFLANSLTRLQRHLHSRVYRSSIYTVIYVCPRMKSALSLYAGERCVSYEVLRHQFRVN